MKPDNFLKTAAMAILLALFAALPAAAQDIVKIGQIEAQTGALTYFGWMSSQGTRLAVDEINKAGGFKVGNKTYKLELIAPDTRGNPQEALIQMKQLLEQEKVKYIFGPFLTNVFNGIDPYPTVYNGKFLMMGGVGVDSIKYDREEGTEDVFDLLLFEQLLR